MASAELDADNLDPPANKGAFPLHFALPRATPDGVKGRLAVLAVGAVALAQAGALARAAAATTFHIQNARGVPQVASLYQGAGQLGPRTDPFGNLTIAVTPGDTFYFSRNQTDGHCYSGEQASPEGSPGQAYTVPAEPPASVTITLPAVPYTPTNPGLDDQ